MSTYTEPAAPRPTRVSTTAGAADEQAKAGGIVTNETAEGAAGPGRPIPRTLCTALAVAVLLVAACSGGDDESASDDEAPGVGTGEELATLEVIDQQIAVKTTESDEFEPGTTGMGLDVGYQIRSNDTGFGELGYFDGSWMRIEARATLTIEELSDTEESRAVETSIDGGRVWSRTEKLTGSGDRFDVGSPVGTASVRGTRFSIDCTVDWGQYAADVVDADAGEDEAPDATTTTDTPTTDTTPTSAELADDLSVCEFTVIEGEVMVTLLDGTEYVLGPSQRLVAADDGRTPIGPLQVLPDELYATEWIQKNLGVDREKPNADELLAGEAEANVSAATLAQEWTVDVDVVASTDPRFVAGTRDEGFWQVSVECTPAACRSGRQVVDADGEPALRDGAGNPIVDEIVPLGNGSYEFRSQWVESCERDGTTLAVDGVATEKIGRYEVTELAFIDGQWVATELRGTVTTTTTLTASGEAADCALPDNAPSVSFTTEVVARADV